MIPFYRFLEAGLYSLLSFLPFILLAIYPFRRHLRFSPAVSTGLLILICVVQIGLGFMATFTALNPGILSALSTVIYALFYFSFIKDYVGRLAFMLLVMSNTANLVAILSKCLEGLLFGDLALEPYRWSLCVCMLIMHLLITAPLSFYIHKYFTGSIPIQASCWSYLWLIPTTFYVIWYYHLYLASQTSLQVALDIHNSVFLLFMNIGAFVVYHTTVLLLQALQKAQLLTEQNLLLSMHKLQYDNLQQRINEARQAKHDVRHHTHLIREYLQSGKLQELESYLDSYTDSLPDTHSIVYCRHYATNALLGYFVQQARNRGIEMDVFVQLPEKVALPETTLSVVLGNLLENAIDATGGLETGKKVITVRGKANKGAVFFEITNPYQGELRKSKSGTFLSTKATNRGMGLDSVAQLAKAHGGMLELETEGGLFRASILLPEQIGE